jgi:hypothetical protein
MDDTGSSHPGSNFQATIDEAKEEATGVWDKVRQVASHSHVMFYIYNATAQTFSLSAASWDLDGLEERSVIQPWDYLSFVLRGDVPAFAGGKLSTQLKHSFTYHGASQAFEFSTGLNVKKEFESFSFTPKTVPQRVHAIRSIGRIPLACASHVTRSMAVRPYHYGVVITLGGNF